MSFRPCLRNRWQWLRWGAHLRMALIMTFVLLEPVLHEIALGGELSWADSFNARQGCWVRAGRLRLILGEPSNLRGNEGRSRLRGFDRRFQFVCVRIDALAGRGRAALAGYPLVVIALRAGYREVGLLFGGPWSSVGERGGRTLEYSRLDGLTGGDTQATVRSLVWSARTRLDVAKTDQKAINTLEPAQK